MKLLMVRVLHIELNTKLFEARVKSAQIPVQTSPKGILPPSEYVRGNLRDRVPIHLEFDHELLYLVFDRDSVDDVCQPPGPII